MFLVDFDFDRENFHMGLKNDLKFEVDCIKRKKVAGLFS